MAHKADESFFEKKKDWSKYKDLVLAYYLTPYLSHVRRRKYPILLVDLFAGPGVFGDGSSGSPIILLDAAKRLSDSGYDASVLLVEHNRKLASRLKKNVDQYGSLADVRCADWRDLVDEVAKRATDHTVFLYVDPWNVSRLHLGEFARIFERVSTGSSVEVLFVFMADAFMRFARSCLNAETAEPLADPMVNDPVEGFSTLMAEALYGQPSVRRAKYALTSSAELDAIAGGDYWREFATMDEGEYPEKLGGFVAEYCKQLRPWFRLVCPFPIHGQDNARIPKYWLVFMSRYTPAIDLINRAMAKARQEQFEEWKGMTLFADVELPPEMTRQDLEQLILDSAAAIGPSRWERLRWRVTAQALGMFTDSQINTAIKSLLVKGQLTGPTGKKVDNDAEVAIPHSRAS